MANNNYHQLRLEESIPFQVKFLHPKNWGLWLVFAVIFPLIYLPLAVQFWFGKLLGLLVYHLSASRRKVTLVNLKLAFPQKTDDERLQMAREVFINQGIGVFESLCAWFRPHLFLDTASIEGLEPLLEAQKQNKAILMLGGHYTMLDLGGRLCMQFFPADCVYRPQNNDMLEWFIFNARRRMFGSQIEHKDMRKLVACIKAGEIIWYSPDQDFGLKQGVMAPFFGVPAATITAPRRLAKLGNKSNPPLVMALHTYRKKQFNNGKPEYHITITPALENYPTDDEVADASRVNTIFENLINKAPTQWMWFHKRYKHDENGRTKYYD